MARDPEDAATPGARLMRAPADLLERSPQEATRLIALGFLKEAVDARARLGDPSDSEALHDFRVAVRRLRSSCRAFRPFLKGSLPKKFRRGLRELTSATNQARDAEVLLALLVSELPPGPDGGRNGADWLVHRLESRRAQAQERIGADAVAPFDELEPRLRRRLGRFETTVHLDQRRPRRGFGRVAGKLVREHVVELGELLALVTGPDQDEIAHRARIAAKRLRYLLESLARRSKRARSLVTALKGLQDVLGELHDAQVLDIEIVTAAATAAASGAIGVEVAGPPAVAPTPEEVATLRAVARRRAAELYEKLKAEWLEGRARPMLERIDTFGASLERRRAAEHTEIERKYLLTGVPDVAKEVTPLEIDQGWLAGQLVDERVRRTRSADADTFSRTIKLGEGIVRSEFEESMTPETFDTMWLLTVNRRISKRRYQVKEGERTWEIDEFTDRELVLAEVELPAEDEAVTIPGWLAPYVVREVTGEPEYVNVNLAK